VSRRRADREGDGDRAAGGPGQEGAAVSAAPSLHAPFPWFGGKSAIGDLVWARFGRPKQYIEPFCGSAATLLASPAAAPLEVIGDGNYYVANFWRAVRSQSESVSRWMDYPVSHIDLYARHRWLTDPPRTEELRASLLDPDWPGDAKIAGWWVWGQCAWIGSGWCDGPVGESATLGKVPHTGNPGRGVQSMGQIPHLSSPGQGATSLAGGTLIAALSDRLKRVRIIHGDWQRCMHHSYGKNDTAVMLDPPYVAFEKLYSGGDNRRPVALEVADWARAHPELRIALCGHVGDYDLPGWEAVQWTRTRASYGSTETRDRECVWFSPGCERPRRGLFD
jgi:hypothetical protein